MNPTVSVIIPCFNQARFLPDCIASLQAQTYPHWEAIIVNDGSRDDTREVALKLREGEPRIRYIEQENRGLPGARNSGMAESRGDFIQFLDADDLILPNKLEAQISLFSGQSDLAVVYSDFAFFNDGDTATWVDSPAHFKAKYGTPDMLRSLLSGNFIVVHSALTRRAEIEKLGGFDPDLEACEDYDLWLRLAALGKKFAYCAGIHALYRQHPAGMASNRPRQIQHTISVLERVPNFLSINKEEAGIWNQYLAALHLDLIAEVRASQSETRPRVSVCIPTFNGARYVKECLDSVVAQSMKDVEVIIVDDQSTDETWELLQVYSVLHPEAHMRLFRNEKNLGLVANWNRCIELARGEWIKFVFQDDLIAPTCLERLLTTAREQAAQLVICRREFRFEEGTDTQLKQALGEDPTIWSVFGDAPFVTPQDISMAALRYFGTNLVGEPTGVMLHRTVFERFGKFNPAFIQICDWEYWLRVACNIGVACVPEVLATFRVHGGATSAGNREGRHFRMILLDQLLLRHELAYNGFFSPIQHVSRQSDPPVNLKLEMAQFAYWVRNVAKRSNHDHADENSGELQEWEGLVARYPLLEKTWYMRRIEIQHWFARHVGWRLNPKTSRPG